MAIWFPKNGNRSTGLDPVATFNDNLSFCVVVDTKGGISTRTKLLVAAAALCYISSGGSLVFKNGNRSIGLVLVATFNDLAS